MSDVQNLGLYRNATWSQGQGAPLISHDPATAEVTFACQSADAAQVQAAIADARKAFPAWSRQSREARIAILEAYGRALQSRATEIAEAISRDMGKALWESQAEVSAMVGKIAISVQAYQARTGDTSGATAFGATALDHRPWGVMAVLGPFNFPGHLPNGHIVPALLAGNCVVFKPSELAPKVACLMVEAFEEAGLPAGVLNVVMGGRETGQALLTAQGIDGVLFTGSATTGIAIHQMFAGRPEVILALEMGGNNPLIIWEPAQIEAAADLLIHSAFITSGQRCSCARRIILPQGKFGDAVIEAVGAAIDTMVIGPWNHPTAPFIGPVIHAAQAQRVSVCAQEWQALGGKSLIAPKIGVEGPAFVRPGLMDMSVAQNVPDEELFAPFAQVYRAATLDEAIHRANATRFGLSAGLVCDDAQTWQDVRISLRAGLINWNRPTTGASSALPFGGPGLSGNGRPSAFYAADYCAFPVARQEASQALPMPAPGLATQKGPHS
ncbi:MAG: succinylglutamate-semialdehyde dehydrogenase [Pseudomonadota bacterium]|jgi:succinylglutamic semialdehyde dehydrogenase